MRKKICHFFLIFSYLFICSLFTLNQMGQAQIDLTKVKSDNAKEATTSTSATTTSNTTTKQPSNTNLEASEHLNPELLRAVELWQKILFILENYYYQKIDYQKLMDAALKGMLSSLDPHSTYFDPQSLKKFEKDTNGEFYGLGLEVSLQEGMIVVVSTLEDSAAFKANIRSGDKILQINKKNVVGVGLDKVMDLLKEDKEKKDQKVELVILKNQVQTVQHVSLLREKVKLKACKFWMIDDIGVLRLTQFQRDLASEIEKSLERVKKDHPLKSLIIDLRDNPGGLLDEAVKVASLFLDSGVVVKTINREGKALDIKYVLKSGMKELTVPIVLLINRGTASAAEILAGALQDNRRALLMGEKSFGKGSVQSLIKLEGDAPSAIKLTISQYVTPLGREIQQKGLTPDILFNDPKVVEEKDLPALNKEVAKETKDLPKQTREKDLAHSLLPASASKKVLDPSKVEEAQGYPYNDLMVQSAEAYLKGKQLFDQKNVNNGR